MKLNIFKKEEDKKKKQASPKAVVKDAPKEEATVQTAIPNIKVGSNNSIRNFYISEKATNSMVFNQYVFKVFNYANKKTVREQVEKMFNVKVKDVKILNTPEKTRNVGRFSGKKPGFKKAVVVLKEGYVINQAKP